MKNWITKNYGVCLIAIVVVIGWAIMIGSMVTGRVTILEPISCEDLGLVEESIELTDEMVETYVALCEMGDLY